MVTLYLHNFKNFVKYWPLFIGVIRFNSSVDVTEINAIV